MKVLVTGGAGFMGRWVVKKLVNLRCQVYVLDDFSTGCAGNLQDFIGNPCLRQVIYGDIKDFKVIQEVFGANFDLCIHLAAWSDVRGSLDNPTQTFETDLVGTFNIMEEARKTETKLVFLSTALVYQPEPNQMLIDETQPVTGVTPYTAAKLAGEALMMGYYYTYKLPVVIIRPTFIYGPYQRFFGEGGVCLSLLQACNHQQEVKVLGRKNDIRDFLYIEDCAELIVRAAMSEDVNGQILNAASGYGSSLADLAVKILGRERQVTFLEDLLPVVRPYRLVCSYEKAKKLLNWQPTVSFDEGILRTKEWWEKICVVDNFSSLSDIL